MLPQPLTEAAGRILPCKGVVHVAILNAVDVYKRFGGVRALNGATLQCEAGEVHALLGANGSGKSTLAKVITGAVAADSGVITINGLRAEIKSPADMKRFGIAAVYQELSLIPQLTMAENITLNNEPLKAWGGIDNRAALEKAREVARRFEKVLGRELPLNTKCAELSPSEQQICEILKALVREPQILILDEATASLHQEEVKALFDIISELKSKGCCVIFISHRMEEIYEICDRATILRNGETVGTVEVGKVESSELVNMMVGQGLDLSYSRPERKSLKDSTEILRVRDLTTDVLKNVSFELHEGEILGLGGLQGQGQSELLSALFGATRIISGEIEVGGKTVEMNTPEEAIRNGIALVPGNRAQEGLFLIRPTLENINFTSMKRRSRFGWLDPKTEYSTAERLVKELEIQVGDLKQPVSSLSGGNQQKVVVAKWLLNEPRVLLLDDATKGVDVRAKAEIFAIIGELAKQGVGIILNSSDNMELLSQCDRILVFYEGEAVETLSGDIDENDLVSAALRTNRAAG